MITALRTSVTARIAVLLVCITCATPVSVALAAQAKVTVHYTPESMQVYEEQLAGNQIQAAKFNRKAHSLHLTLRDGSHVRISYGAHQQGKLAAALKAQGVAVAAPKKPSHTKRYLAAGAAVIVVIALAIGIVLLIRRKRANAE
jgi:hypothetical protein